MPNSSVRDSVEKLTVDENFLLQQSTFLFRKENEAVSTVLEDCTLFRMLQKKNLTKLLVSQREDHDKGIAQAENNVEAAKLDVKQCEEELKQAKAKADEGKKLVTEDRRLKLEQIRLDKLAKMKQTELEYQAKQKQTELEYDAMTKDVISQCDSRDQAHDDAAGSAGNALEICKKVLSNAEKEVANREENKLEMVELAQIRLDLMNDVTVFVNKIEMMKQPSENEEELTGEVQAIVKKIHDYNAMVEKINRGTFHVEADDTDSL